MSVPKVQLVPRPTRGVQVEPEYGSAPTDAFFPPAVAASIRRWYGKHLAAMSEPSLWQTADPSCVSIRFLWLRTFDVPIAVRIQQTGKTRTLIATRLTGAGGYEPGVVDARRERELTQAEWERLRRAIQEANLDTLPEPSLGFDGAEWILESRTSDEYKMIAQWTPSKNGPLAEFRRTCEVLLDLAGRDLIKGDVY